MTKPKPHDKLAKRLQVLWMAVSGEAQPRGAYAWFARRSGLAYVTVKRWAVGMHAPAEGSQQGAKKAQKALALLAELEGKHEKEIPAAERRWRHYWKTRGR